MAEAEEIQEEIQEEVVEEEIKEEEVKEDDEKKEEEVNSSNEKEFDKKGFIQRQLDKLKGGGKVTPEEEGVVEEKEGELISETFIDAASELGWTEEEIKDFAEGYSDKELDEMIPFLSVEESQPGDDQVKADEKVLQEEKPNKEESEELKAVKQKLTDLEEKFGAVEKDKAAKEQVDLNRRVDDIFDRAGEKFKVFGLTKELPTFPAGPRKGQVIPTSPEYKTRMDVFAVAA